MKHPETVLKYPDSLAQLATDLGNLRYDALAEFLEAFSAKLAFDSEQDRIRGRLQLAQSLAECAQSLTQAQYAIEEAWRISEPYMKDAD